MVELRARWFVLFSLLLTWCAPPPASGTRDGGGGDEPAEASVDGDADSDSDADSDTDSDADSDGDVPRDAGGDSAEEVDGAGSYDASGGDAGCAVTCEEEVDPQCLADEVCGNGSDDDCDLSVDEGCTCTPGSVQPCFLGPPGYRNQGSCTDGYQTCHGVEFGQWGPCEGGIRPSTEVCDEADNDCNGCADDRLCCDGELDCPEPGDPRIPDTTPFSDYPLRGGDFFLGTATAWSWEVHGPPCDRMRERTGHAARSYTLTGAAEEDLTIRFTLSGDYTVTLRVTTLSGETVECTFIVHVRGPGIRVELCWDRLGFLRTDLDLHLHRSGTTTDWFGEVISETENTVSNDDCHFCNCKANLFCDGADGPSDWGYSDTDLEGCTNGPGGAGWRAHGACRNPRLDIDNFMITDGAKPENINLDNPNEGDDFRVMVHFYSGILETHPIVNVYCGGFLVGTFGDTPDEVSGFTGAGGEGWGAGQMWRVVDVTTRVAAGEVTCDLDPLRDPADGSDYWLTENDTSY